MRANKLVMFCRKRLPTILTIVSTISGAAALYFTGRATVKAVRKYDRLKADGVGMTPKVIVKQFVPYYIPAIGFATSSMLCDIGCNTIHVKRNRALTLAATSAMETLRDFKTKTKEIVGEERVKEIETAQARDTKLIRGISYFANEVIRVYDNFTGFKFETTSQKLMDAETEVNRHINNICWGNCQTELRDFYRWMGIDASKIKSSLACNYVWNQDHMIGNWDLSFVDFYHEQVQDNDGTPLIILRYYPEPESESVIKAQYATE